MARALVVAGHDEKPTVQHVMVAEPGAGQARVAVEAASLNGFDIAVVAGYLWDMLPHEFPVVLGRDFAGTVESLGDGVSGIGVGDRVAGVITAMELGSSGAISEQVTVDAAVLVRLPDEVSATQAAALGLAGVTARDLMDALDLSGDDVVLVSGATGGVGAMAVQLAAATGATVLATARPGADTAFVRGLGADEAVDHTGDLAAAVRAVAPQGVTAVVHAAGDTAALAALLRPGGRLASVVGATQEQAGRADTTVIPVMAAATAEKVSGLVEAVAAGTLRVPVADTYRLDDATQALADFGGHKLGKLVVTLS